MATPYVCVKAVRNRRRIIGFQVCTMVATKCHDCGISENIAFDSYFPHQERVIESMKNISASPLQVCKEMAVAKARALNGMV